MRITLMGKRVIPYLILLIPVGILLQNPEGFPYPAVDSIFSDMAITHYPNALFLKRQLFEQGIVPLWSPAILSGYPFAANPLSGLWYPPGWFALFFPLPLGLNLTASLHLLLGGLGMFLLLKSEGLGKRAAFFGALTFESMPKIFAHYGAGHLTLLYAIVWTPWLLWLGKRSFEKGGRNYLLPPMIIGLILLADPRWIIFSGLFWFGYVTARGYYWKSPLTFTNNVRNVRSFFRHLKFPITGLLIMAGQGVLGLLIASPFLIPFLEYTFLSTRSSMTNKDLLAFSLPPERLLGYFYPDFGGFHEYMVYSGAAVIVLVLFALMIKDKSANMRFWLWAALISILYALGSNSPLASLLSSLPGFDLLRVPSRALFASSICLAAVASHIVDMVVRGVRRHKYRGANLLLFGFISLIVLMGLGIWLFAPDRSLSFLYGALFSLILFIWVDLGIQISQNGKVVEIEEEVSRSRIRKWLTIRTWYLVLVALAMIDWILVDQSLLVFRSTKEVLAEGADVALYLTAKGGYFRVYSPSYSLPQNTAMLYGLELADGVDPLQYKEYVDYMEYATGVSYDGYSVTVPPFANGNPAEDNRLSVPNPEQLGLLNVRYVVSEFDLEVEGLEWQALFGESRVYENMRARPRAWLEPKQGNPPGDNLLASPVTITKYGPNRIELTACGPGILVLSEVYYPGWGALVDGEVVDMGDTFRKFFRAIPLEEGDHHVVVVYRPYSVLIGGIFFAIGLLIIGMLSYVFSRKEKNLNISEGQNYRGYEDHQSDQ